MIKKNNLWILGLTILLIHIVFLNGNFNLIQGADTWLHLDIADELAQGEKIGNSYFLDAGLHYPPLSYYAALTFSKVINQNMQVTFNIIAIVFSLLKALIIFTFVYRLTKSHIAAILTAFIATKLVAEFDPRAFGEFYLYLYLFLFLYYIQNEKFQMEMLGFIAVIVAFTHYQYIIHIIIVTAMYSIFQIQFFKKKIIHFTKKISFSNPLESEYVPFLIVLSLIPIIYYNREIINVVTEFPISLIYPLTIIGFLYAFSSFGTLKEYKADVQLFILSILFLATNMVFYYPLFFTLHHLYFVYTPFILIWIPFGIATFEKHYSHKKLLATLFIVCFLITGIVTTNYYTWYTNSSNDYYQSEKAQFNTFIQENNITVDNSVILFHPSSFLNRFVPINSTAKIYAVNVIDENQPRPMTTIDVKLEPWGFYPIVQRNKIANDFFRTFDTAKLEKERIDYIFIETRFLSLTQKLQVQNMSEIKNDKFVFIDLK